MSYLMNDFIENPDWLNEELLRYALSEFGDVIEIVDYTQERGVPLGTNYMSYTYKVCVRFKVDNQDEIRTLYFFMKDPVGGMLSEWIEEGRTVEKELRVYAELVPLVRQYKSVDVYVKSYPTKVKNLLVLEDLSVKGFVMKDKITQVDFATAAMALQTLAKYHALSVAVHHQDPGLIESLGRAHAYEKKTNKSYKIAKDNFKELGEKVSEWEGCEKYGEYLKTLYKNYDERLDGVWFGKSPVLNVLNHGDSWCGNMLIQVDELGNPLDGKMIDHANLCYGSCGIDLNIFLFTSVKPEVLRNRLSELYDKYVDTLNWCLQEFGCSERMTRQQLEEEMKRTGFQSLYSVFLTAYYMYNNYEDLDENNHNRDIYDRKIFRSNTMNVLHHLEDIGYQ